MKNKLQINRNFGISLQKNTFSKAFQSIKCLMTQLLFVSLLLSNLLIVFPSANPVFAQKRKVVTVTADQPNIWTLEQAHYLLGTDAQAQSRSKG